MASKKTIFSTPWFSIESEEYEHLGMKGDQAFFRVIEGDSVVVLATTPEGKVVLIRQFRPAIETVALELPAGQIDSGETAMHAAERELYEETGYKCKEYELLSPEGISVANGRMKSNVYIVRGTDAVRDPGFRDEENLEVALIEYKELKHMARQGTFTQLAGIAAMHFHES